MRNSVLLVWILTICFITLTLAAYLTVQYLDTDSLLGQVALLVLTLFAMFGGIQRATLLVGEILKSLAGDARDRRK